MHTTNLIEKFASCRQTQYFLGLPSVINNKKKIFLNFLLLFPFFLLILFSLN